MVESDEEIVTVRLPEKDQDAIRRLVEKGEFRNRSDFLRFAVKRALLDLGADGVRPPPALDLEAFDIPSPNAAAVPSARRGRLNARGTKR